MGAEKHQCVFESIIGPPRQAAKMDKDYMQVANNGYLVLGSWSCILLVGLIVFLVGSLVRKHKMPFT